MSEAVPAPVVHELLQVLMVVGAAATVDCDAETPPALTVTVAVWVMLTVFAVAETVLASAAVELRVQVATPLPLAVWVRPAGTVELPVPEVDSVTLAPGTVLPN